MRELGLLVGAIAIGVSFVDWRKGVLLALVVGFAADPVRKLLPGQPVALTMAVAVIAFTAVAGMLQRKGPGLAFGLLRRYPTIRSPLQAFLLWVAIAACLTLVNYGSFVLAGIGVIAYLAPIPGVLLGYYFGSSLAQMKRFFLLYLAGATVMVSGVYLQQLGVNWTALGQIGEEIIISHLGEVYGGFFRVPEVAAWHAGAAASLLIVLGTTIWRESSKPLVAVAVLFLVAGGLLTGRRKMIAQLLLFVCLYGLTLAYFRRETKRLVSLALVVVFLGALGLNEFLETSQRQVRFGRYFDRGATVFESAPARATQLGLRSVVWSYRRHGLLGGGAGIASQGAQHFGGGIKLGGGGAEGGLGKIMAELGLPGLFLSFWLGFAILGAAFIDVGRLARRAPPLSTLSAGLLAFLASQIPSFAVAAPIYGDPFVLILLGVVLGFVFAVSSWGEPAARVVGPVAGSPPAGFKPAAYAPPGI